MALAAITITALLETFMRQPQTSLRTTQPRSCMTLITVSLIQPSSTICSTHATETQPSRLMTRTVSATTSTPSSLCMAQRGKQNSASRKSSATSLAATNFSQEAPKSTTTHSTLLRPHQLIPSRLSLQSTTRPRTDV